MVIESERDFINFVKKFEYPHPYVKTSIGDDVCILDLDNVKLAITSDSYKENVHFDFNYLNFYEVGFRCMAGALSDLASCGAEPLTFLLDFFIPDRLIDNNFEYFLNEIYRGIIEIAKRFGANLGGGDIVIGGKEFSFSITCIGKLEGDYFLRKGANPGDLLCITGDLGRVYAAFEILSKNLRIDYLLMEKIVEKFKYPIPRIAEMVSLKEKIKITSAIDISDGLAKDALELSYNSEVKLVVHENKLPFLEELKKYTEMFNKNIVDYIINSGEEYEVLFTIDSSYKNFLPPWVKIIGEVEEGEGVFLKTIEGELVEIKGGYDHFKKLK